MGVTLTSPQPRQFLPTGHRELTLDVAGGAFRIVLQQNRSRRLVGLNDALQHDLCNVDCAGRREEARLVDGGIQGNQLGGVVEGYLHDSVNIGFLRLLDILSEQLLTTRCLLMEPLRMNLMMLREPGDNEGCQGTDRGAGQR